MGYILARLKEPSTWAGIGGFVGALGVVSFSTELWQAISGVGMAVAALAAVILKEKAKA